MMIHKLFTVGRLKRKGEMRWCILKDGQYVGSIATYLQAFRIVEGLNANAELTVAKIAEVQETTRGESYRDAHLADVLTARKFV